MEPLIFDSVEHMVSADGLELITGTCVEAIERAPLDAAHFSGNTLERVVAHRQGQTWRFVLKRFSIERDWIMRLTDDQAVREVTLFRQGVYARLPDECYVPILAVARDGMMWASLMLDVSAGLDTPSDAPLKTHVLQRYLEHLAAVHARFWNDTTLRDPALGLSSLRDFVQILASTTVDTECMQGRSHRVLEAARQGWRIFADIAPPEVVRIVTQLEQDPKPLIALIERGPQTLLHGDFKAANLGAWPPGSTTPRTIILDWQDAAYGAPLLDLGYFLALSATRLPVPKETAVQMYRAALATYGCSYSPEWWQRDLEIGLLAGGALRLLWQKALATQTADPMARQRLDEEFRWWSDLVMRARRWLS